MARRKSVESAKLISESKVMRLPATVNRLQTPLKMGSLRSVRPNTSSTP